MRMSNNPADRRLRLPPANFSELKIPRTRQPARGWFRLHQSGHSPTRFSLDAHHRYSHQDCPYQVLYLGADAHTCLFERFGDKAYDNQNAIPQSLWHAHGFSTIHVPDIRVCDLTNARTLTAMRVDLSSFMHTSIAVPQEWGLAIQRHPARFQGIKFKSRFNGKACLALFQRDGVENRLRKKQLDTLSNDGTAVEWLDKYQIALY
jgi:hypothetical protein